MTSEAPQQNGPLASAAATEDKAVHSAQQETKPVSGETPQTEQKVKEPVLPEPTGDIQLRPAPTTDGPSGSGFAAAETQVPAETREALSKPKEEPQTGEKRDHGSDAGPASENQDKPVAGKPDEPDTKKQKTDEKPSQEANGPKSTPAAGGSGSEPKKAGRPKKDKSKDAKKPVTTDGIGSRTRSRTKAT